MTETRPAPLAPAEVDLRDFAFMPLDVLRLRDSDLSCVEDAEVFRCAVLSWCVAWHQTPAASLPDDDTLLSRLLGFGRDVKGWKRIRAAGGLRGWIECDDGRLYHPVVAEKARDAWRGKLEQRWRTEAARVKKHNQRHRLDGDSAVVMPEFDEWMSLGCPWGQSLPVPGTRSDCPERQPTPVPREIASKGQGEGQGQGQGDLLNTPPDGGSGPAPRAEPPAPPPAPPFDGTNAEALNGKAVVPIAVNWALPEQWGIDAEALGWRPAEVEREAEKFRQYWTAGTGKGTRRSVKGWRQSWSTWLDKAARNHR